MYACNISDATFELFCAILNVWVCHLNWLKHICLLLKLFLLSLEVLHAVCEFRALDLFTSVILDLFRCLLDILSAELYQAQVLLEIFLLTLDTSFFNL